MSIRYQTLFDIAVPAVVAQGEPCLQDGVCVLINAKGQRCALGFIPQATSFALEDGPFLEGLQHAHDLADRTQFVDSFIQRANAVATQFNLVPFTKKSTP